MTDTLAARLREHSQGRDEWRVQDPKDGSYCIAYSRDDGYSLDPERKAREWLTDHQRKHPTSRFAGYVAACVRVQTQAERDMQEAADALDAQAAEIAALRAVLLRVTDALDRLGDESDGDVSPRVWVKNDGSGSVKAGRAALRKEQGESPNAARKAPAAPADGRP